jgi:hypothetical protein
MSSARCALGVAQVLAVLHGDHVFRGDERWRDTRTPTTRAVERCVGGLDKHYRLHKWLGIAAALFALAHWLSKKYKWLIELGLYERRDFATPSGTIGFFQHNNFLNLSKISPKIWVSGRFMSSSFWPYSHFGKNFLTDIFSKHIAS